MPVRLLRPYAGQAVNTLYWDTATNEDLLRATGNADDRVELASDYVPYVRYVAGATATVSRYATEYRMNSASAQSLTLPLTGYWSIGQVITVRQMGSAKTTIAPAAGITIVQGNGVTSLLTNGQGYLGQLIKDSSTQWTAFGGFGG